MSLIYWLVWELLSCGWFCWLIVIDDWLFVDFWYGWEVVNLKIEGLIYYMDMFSLVFIIFKIEIKFFKNRIFYIKI